MSQPGYAGSLISLWIQPELEFQEIPLTEPLDRFYVFQKVVMHYYDAIVE